MSEWKLIETAPKSYGTWIEAWRPIQTTGTMQLLVYVTWKTFEDGDFAWVWPDDTYQVFTEEGRDDAEAMIDKGDHYEDLSFTHWRELSVPPK